MKQIVSFGIILFAMSAVAAADPCTDLVRQAQTGLQMQGLDSDTRETLEDMLRDGRSGDIGRCQQATRNVFQSSPEGEKAPARNRCSDQAHTV
jgi:hypothetical protein